MKIGFSGANSTGKTTLALELSKQFDIPCIHGITRRVAKRFPINEAGDNECTQLAVMLEHFDVLTKRDFIADRTILDCTAATDHLLGSNHYLTKAFCDIVSARISEYDLLIYTPIEFPLTDDGERSTNEEFREAMDHYIAGFFSKLASNNKNVIKVTGSVEERLEQIAKAFPNIS